MALFLLITSVYAGFLILYKPAPNSLKSKHFTLIENCNPNWEAFIYFEPKLK